MDKKTIFEAFEKATYTIGMCDFAYIYPEDIDKFRKYRDKNHRQQLVFRARLARILGIEE